MDVHAMGARQSVHRKLIPGGHRAVILRLGLGIHESVLGVSASEIAGRIVPIQEMWGAAESRRLFDRLSGSKTSSEAAFILKSAIGERHARAVRPCPSTALALDASRRLMTDSVSVVAADIGMSERHLRRVFREAVGVSPKTFAKLARFRRALRAARADAPMGWASIAAAAGYYDQAHLIAEFRAISGVTPRALLDELARAS